MKRLQDYSGEFLDINTPEKAYLLGFFYADGCVNTDMRGCCLVVKDTDTKILENIRQVFPFFCLSTTSKNTSVLHSGIVSLVKDLCSRGVINRKSYENKEDLSLPDMPKSLYSHFIRGFFDGDGSVFIQKINNIKVEIGCVSYRFITQLLKILYDSDINMVLSRREPNISSLRVQDYYRMYTSSYKESKKFSDYIYQGECELFLERKRILLQRELIPRNSKVRKICPICGSIETVYGGFRSGKIRIYCKSCNKRSQIAPEDSDILRVQD
jgi:hypothetical protein